MSREFFTSIRFKVFMLYVIGLFLTLAFFNILVYLNYKESLERKIDSLLDAKVQAVESAVRTYWTAQAQAAGPRPRWFEELVRGGQKKTAPPDPYDIIIRYLGDDVLSSHMSEARIDIDVFDSQGRLMDSSLPDRTPATLDKTVLGRVLTGEKVLYGFTLKPVKHAGKSAPIRALVAAIRMDEQVFDIVRARVFMKPIRDELRYLMIQLFVRSLFVILVASWGSLFLVQATLAPVDQMIRTIRSIKHDNLDRRIQVPRTGDEIARLAETFNAVLEKLEKSFRSQTQIVQDISHELRTPLTILSGQIEVITKKKRSPKEYEEMLYSSLEEIAKVRRIIDNLLLLARFDNPGHSLDMKKLDLNRLWKGSCRTSSCSAAKKN